MDPSEDAKRSTAASGDDVGQGAPGHRSRSLRALKIFFLAAADDLRHLLMRAKLFLRPLAGGVASSATRVAEAISSRRSQANWKGWWAGFRTPRLPKLRRGGRWRTRATYGATILLLAIPVSIAAVAYWALHDLSYEALAGTGSEPVVVLEAADGTLLVRDGSFRAPDAPLTSFPHHTIQAVLSVEDRRFWDHGGLDWRGIARAFVSNLSAGRVVEGGSTITQQLVKIRHLDQGRTFKRKIQEAVLAFMAEERLGKQQILERYLNEIYMGAGAHGFPAAAMRYFGKEVGELAVEESAMLAGLIRAPARLNPLVSLSAARGRAETVIDVMEEEGHLSASEAEMARAAIGRLQPTEPVGGSGSWFADWVTEAAQEVAGTFRGPVTVRTTLDPRLQAVAEEAIRDVLAELGDGADASEAALVALRPDGAVVAMVGGQDYEASKFNRAVQARRQPGSTFKLFVYHAALKAGLETSSIISDTPQDYDGYVPENFDGRYHGRVSLAEAFARSLNAATVNLAMDIGLDAVAQSAEELGIEAELTPTPSLALGASEATLLDMTEAYAAIRAGRAPIEAHGLAGFSMGEGQFFRIGAAEAPANDIEPVQRPLTELLVLAVEKGTGQAARMDGPVAGKTGTSQENRDAWFIGFNERLVAGVWVGNDDNSPMSGVTGGSLPAEIWKRFMTGAADVLDAPPDAAPQLPEGEESAPAQVSIEERRRQRQVEPGASIALAVEGPRCNVRACSRAYRSFRASDCTFQPYRGPRKLCER